MFVVALFVARQPGPREPPFERAIREQEADFQRMLRDEEAFLQEREQEETQRHLSTWRKARDLAAARGVEVLRNVRLTCYLQPAGESPGAEPPAGESPAGESPGTEPPAGEPPAGESPGVEPPAGEPPAGESPGAGRQRALMVEFDAEGEVMRLDLPGKSLELRPNSEQIGQEFHLGSLAEGEAGFAVRAKTRGGGRFPLGLDWEISGTFTRQGPNQASGRVTIVTHGYRRSDASKREFAVTATIEDLPRD
ncbi:MAG: hypothetical protein KDD82_12910 [Planctomycetes bacterium]|nr:hypothetical protein [Planctomycetota bacterium]